MAGKLEMSRTDGSSPSDYHKNSIIHVNHEGETAILPTWKQELIRKKKSNEVRFQLKQLTQLGTSTGFLIFPK